MDMDRRTLRVFNRLRPMYIFKGMTDEALVELTAKLESKTASPGEAICMALQAGDAFYIVDKGTVTLSTADQKRSQTLEPGDFFGAEGLLERLQPYTVTAGRGEVILLRLDKVIFNALLQAHPRIRVALELMARTRALYFSRIWDWLPANERVYLATQRHPVLLLQRLLGPLAGLIGVLSLAALAWIYLDVTWAAWIAGIGLGLVGLWALLVYIDWGNDFYFVTNNRVVYVEKIILIYDSRTSVAMNALTSVAAETAGLADRLLEYGDVSVKTLSRPLLLQAIAYPQIVAALVEEHIYRTRTQSRQSDFEYLKGAIKNRLEPPMAQPKLESLAGVARPPAKSPLRREPIGRVIQRYFSFQLRYDEGDTIIYRKHWWILLTDLWIPSLLILLDAGLIGLSIGVATGFGGNFLPEPVTESALLLVALVLFIPLAGWWLYQFEDWRNDLYQVTPDQLIDIYRKPLGRETRDSTTLDRIQGLHAERPNLIGRLLNFGNVAATIPGKEFTFDDVLDPTGVQDDIQRRIEAMRARKAKQEVLQRREEMADVLSAYHKALQEIEQQKSKSDQ
jgi:hypothetical protein